MIIRIRYLCLVGLVVWGGLPVFAQGTSTYPDPPEEPPWMAQEETGRLGLTMQDSPDLGAPSPLDTSMPRPQDVDKKAQKEESQTAIMLPPLVGERNTDTDVVIKAVKPIPITGDPSPLRDLYEKRAGQPLALFGYDMFGGDEGPQEKADADGTTAPLGVVPDEMLLHSGDKVEVVFSGQRTDRDVHRINAQGLLLIPDLPPISAIGRSVKEVRKAIEVAAGTLHNTQAHMSVFSVRQIGVLVVGHVVRPGRQNMNAFHAALDALIAAGGVRTSGSLRAITLHRANGKVFTLDLYDILNGKEGASLGADISLQEGDKIIVPPIGPTVAIAGDVARPGIYELKTSQDVLSLEAMLALAGGVLAPGNNRFLRMYPNTNGREDISTVSTITGAVLPQFSAGTILMVVRGEGAPHGQIRLSGNTRRSGIHALETTRSLGALLESAQVLDEDTYMLAAILERRGTKDVAPHYTVFSPSMVIAGRDKTSLKEGDVVHIFSRAQILGLQRDTPVTKNDLDFIEDPILADVLREHSVLVRGGVRKAGAWPVSDGGASLATLIAVAGGTTRDADVSEVEITYAPKADAPEGPLDDVGERHTVSLERGATLFAGDTVQIGRKHEVLVAGQSVWIGGEVRRPGSYTLMPGETLSDLIARAGGMTAQAYSAGAIFSRAEARRAEEARYRAAAMDIEQAVALAQERKDKNKEMRGPNDEQVAMARALAAELRTVKGLGRVGVEANPDALRADPSLDVVLVAGDRLFIPPRPASVRVIGEVMSPGFMPFRSGKKTQDYINEAAGFTFFGDKKRSFVIYPDGRAARLQVDNWNTSAIFVPPGSTIVVPRDPRPFDFLATARDITQILANLATTAIFIDDVIGGNDED